MTHASPPMELLAPAGSTDAFVAAMDAGADAVYVGAPGFHARNPARELSLREIAAMRAESTKRGVRLYAAINSLVKEDELPDLVRMLAFLDAIKVDALIVQDWGVFHCARRFFPSLRLHASTLMNCHHAAAAAFLAEQGFARVVLARETTLREIKEIHTKTPVDLEVFVHGAMCFSYSGLCLFSSFLGGQSGLRGRCVQPCRRLYQRQGRGKAKEGYYLSMSDLQAARHLPELAAAGVRSLKIEGRLKSATYVAAATRAYRLLLDCDWKRQESWDNALEQAEELLKTAMGRTVTAGFLAPQNTALIHQGRSGNIGVFLGIPACRSAKTGGGAIICTVRHDLSVGDRVRLHLAKTGERLSFRVKQLVVKGKHVTRARAGETVEIRVPSLKGQRPAKGDALFLVDTSRLHHEESSGMKGFSAALKKAVVPGVEQKVRAVLKNIAGEHGARQGPPAPGGRGKTELWVKCDDFTAAGSAKALAPARILVELTRETLRQWRHLPRYKNTIDFAVTWALPAVILPVDLPFYQETIRELVREGCVDWQIAQAGQLPLFAGLAGTHLFGAYTLNVLNSQSFTFFADLGLKGVQVLVETDRKNLELLHRHRTADASGDNTALGLTVYGRLPLSVSRSELPGFKDHEKLTSPKGEDFFVLRRAELSMVIAKIYFSLVGSLDDLPRSAMDYVVVDFSFGLRDQRELKRIKAALEHWRRGKSVRAFVNDPGTPFNFFHGLE